MFPLLIANGLIEKPNKGDSGGPFGPLIFGVGSILNARPESLGKPMKAQSLWGIQAKDLVHLLSILYVGYAAAPSERCRSESAVCRGCSSGVPDRLCYIAEA